MQTVPISQTRSPRRGFTLLEMLTTLAALIVVMGLMVSLARYVRNALAVEVTKDLLHRMDAMMQQYISRHPGVKHRWYRHSLGLIPAPTSYHLKRRFSAMPSKTTAVSCHFCVPKDCSPTNPSAGCRSRFTTMPC